MKHKQKILPWVFILSGLFFGKKMSAQNDTVQYRITIDQELVRIAGEEKMGMTINGSIPGPTFRFTKGDYAMIHVTNEMDVETSIHWHGILLPNFLDGVPYLTTPPIEPGENFTYEFELIQAGTYWYHSHTRLQEQDGVFGSMGQKMERLCNSNRITQSGYHQTSSKYQARNCSGCPLRGACFKGKNNRIVERNHALERYKQQARENLLSEIGEIKRRKWTADVEPVFAHIEYNRNFKRFTHRGLEKVELEFGLHALAHNIRKKSA